MEISTIWTSVGNSTSFKTVNRHNNGFLFHHFRTKFHSFLGISSAKRPRNPAKDHLPRPKLCGQQPIICLSAICEQPQREMETRLDYRERSRRVTSWSHNSSLLGLGLSLSVLWPGCSGLLPNLFSSSLSFASLLYSRSLPCSFTSTSYMYSTNRTYDRSVPFKGFLSHDLRVHQTSM